MTYIKQLVIAVCSLLFLSIGADKFLSFIEPPCSLMDRMPSVIWKTIGVLQLAGGILIWLPRFRKYVVGFFFVFMLIIVGIHLSQGTQDIGGAVFMAVLLGLLVWNPPFWSKNI